MARFGEKRRTSDTARGAVSRLVLRAGAVALGVALAYGQAAAAPVDLSHDADLDAFAKLVATYSSASRVRWVVAAPTLAEANFVIASLGQRFPSGGYALLQRIKPETLGENADLASANVKGPVGWVEPLIGQTSGASSCSWQVWVADPALPTPGAGPANVPLEANDQLPVGSAATFRIVYAGLLQSKTYAFGETQPGAIRDLANATDVNIPVASGDKETIVLAISRQPAPFLESIRTALASSGDKRRDLGRDHALRNRLFGRTRSIGANIQLVPSNMIVAKKTDTTAGNEPARAGDVMETCQFSLIPAPEAMR